MINPQKIYNTYFQPIEKNTIRELIKIALYEDIGAGDITTKSIINTQLQAIGKIIVKENGVIAGLSLLPILLSQNTAKYKIKYYVDEGVKVKRNTIVAEIKTSARILLSIERVMLNYLQHLSGIASLTAQYVESVKKYPVVIMDTRKTTPLLRLLEKYAVWLGGGVNHRQGLFDKILIKDNHIELAGNIEKALLNVRRKYPGLPIEVEVDNIRELKKAIAYHPEIILLDNMRPQQIRQAVKLVKGKIILEASGGINLNNIRNYARTGVDRISIGALTHSAPALDISLDLFSAKL